MKHLQHQEAWPRCFPCPCTHNRGISQPYGRFNPAMSVQVKVDGQDQIAAVTKDGRKITGDILIGADGIRSKVWLLQCDAVNVLAERCMRC